MEAPPNIVPLPLPLGDRVPVLLHVRLLRVVPDCVGGDPRAARHLHRRHLPRHAHPHGARRRIHPHHDTRKQLTVFSGVNL